MLELSSEKQNAHDDSISSVKYNNNGTKIVSACEGAIKVWGALRAPNCQPNFPFLLITLVLNIAGAESLTMIVEKQNAHSREISSVGYNHDGTKIVSACYGGTIKVWDLVHWSRRDHLMFNLTTRRFVLLLLWLTNTA